MTKPAYTDQDVADVMDNPEWTEADIVAARPFSEVFPDLAASARRMRGPQKAPTKALVSIRLDQDVVQRLRDTGPGWQTRVNDVLRVYLDGR